MGVNNKMSKVNFEIASPEKIAEFIYDLKDTLDESNLKQRSGSPCIFVELEPDLKEELFYARELTSRLKEKLVKEIKKKKDFKIERLNRFLERVREEWKQIEETYFNEMKKFFKFKRDKTFFCYINNCIVGAYFGENEVSLPYFKEFEKELGEDEERNLLAEATFTIAEEILHLLYFDYIRKVFGKAFTFEEIYDMGDDKYSGWHLVELIPEYLLVHNLVFEKFGWDKINREEQRYFWITELREKIDPIFKEKSFKDFIIEIHKPFSLKPKKNEIRCHPYKQEIC